MSPFRSLYKHAFYKKNLICLQGIIYNPWSEGWGGGRFVILKDTFLDLSTTLNKMDISKFWLEVFVELMDGGGMDGCC